MLRTINWVIIFLLAISIPFVSFADTTIVKDENKIFNTKLEKLYLHAYFPSKTTEIIVNPKTKTFEPIGFLIIPKGCATTIKNTGWKTENIVYRGEGKPKLIFLQDLNSKEWLLTDSQLYIGPNGGSMAEGQQIEIIGGKDNPIEIDGKNYYDCKFVIKNGVPTKAK